MRADEVFWRLRGVSLRGAGLLHQVGAGALSQEGFVSCTRQAAAGDHVAHGDARVHERGRGGQDRRRELASVRLRSDWAAAIIRRLHHKAAQLRDPRQNERTTSPSPRLEHKDEHVHLRLRKPVEENRPLKRLRNLAAELLLLGTLPEGAPDGRCEGCELDVNAEAALLAEGGAGALAGAVPGGEGGEVVLVRFY